MHRLFLDPGDGTGADWRNQDERGGGIAAATPTMAISTFLTTWFNLRSLRHALFLGVAFEQTQGQATHEREVFGPMTLANAAGVFAEGHPLPVQMV